MQSLIFLDITKVFDMVSSCEICSLLGKFWSPEKVFIVLHNLYERIHGEVRVGTDFYLCSALATGSLQTDPVMTVKLY